MQISLNFKTSCCNLKKIRGLEAKLCVDFLFLNFSNFERNYDVLKSKNLCILLNKNISFNKNETEFKMGNSTHSFKDMNLVLHLIKLQIKSKTVMSWSLRKKKGGIFFYRLFCPEGFFLIFVFYLNV